MWRWDARRQNQTSSFSGKKTHRQFLTMKPYKLDKMESFASAAFNCWTRDSGVAAGLVDSEVNRGQTSLFLFTVSTPNHGPCTISLMLPANSQHYYGPYKTIDCLPTGMADLCTGISYRWCTLTRKTWFSRLAAHPLLCAFLVFWIESNERESMK